MNSSSITKGLEFIVAMELKAVYCVDTALIRNFWNKYVTYCVHSDSNVANYGHSMLITILLRAKMLTI